MLKASPTILLAVGEPALRRLMRATLERDGCIVLEVMDGEHALQVMRRFAGSLDLLVADVALPRMRGDALAERLQSFYPMLKVLYVTGPAGELAPIERIGRVSGDAVLLKPFTPGDLARQVRVILRSEPTPVTVAGVARAASVPS